MDNSHILDYYNVLNIQELGKQSQHTQPLVIKDRLPPFLEGECNLSVSYHAVATDDFYVLNLDVSGPLTVTCQRCLDPFSIDYKNVTAVAVCRTEERAEQLLEEYECIVSSNWKISIEDIVCDELHLYVPEFHQEIIHCDTKLNQFLAK